MRHPYHLATYHYVGTLRQLKRDFHLLGIPSLKRYICTSRQTHGPSPGRAISIENDKVHLKDGSKDMDEQV